MLNPHANAPDVVVFAVTVRLWHAMHGHPVVLNHDLPSIRRAAVARASTQPSLLGFDNPQYPPSLGHGLLGPSVACDLSGAVVETTFPLRFRTSFASLRSDDHCDRQRSIIRSKRGAIRKCSFRIRRDSYWEELAHVDRVVWG